MKILLIAGHGDGDPGALNKNMGYQEDLLAREVVYGIATVLKDYCSVTIYDPEKNLYRELKAGRESKNLFKSFDYVLEVHFNAFNKSASGSECLVKGEKGITVEQGILESLASLGFKNRGVKERTDLQNMNLCRSVGTSYCLLETCFIDSNSDLQLFLANRGRIPQIIAEAILKGFGLKKEDSGVSISTPFKDVSEGDFGLQEIKLLKDLGIVQGHTDGTFKPDDMITRREVAVLLGRLYRHLKS